MWQEIRLLGGPLGLSNLLECTTDYLEVIFALHA